LIVDDTEGCRNGVARLLKHGGYHSLCFCNGSDAPKALESTSPALILLDLAMPVMDGLTFLAIVRSDSRWAHLPVIVISGESEDGPMRRATELGATEVLAKGGITANQLLASVARHVPAGDEPNVLPLR
jgi:chemosensory pili system protein ChpA (sensor histidine kinase/response regulator)